MPQDHQPLLLAIHVDNVNVDNDCTKLCYLTYLFLLPYSNVVAVGAVTTMLLMVVVLLVAEA